MRKTLFRITLAVVLPFLSIGVCSGEPGKDADYIYYQEHIQSKENGVYVAGDRLYVQTRFPLKGMVNQSVLNAKEMSLCNSALKKWAKEHAASQRVDVPETKLGVGHSLAKGIIAEFDPEWPTRSWKINVKSRAYRSGDSDEFVLGRSFSLKEVEDSIPVSFSNPYSIEGLNVFLVKRLPYLLDSDKRIDVLKYVGAADWLDGKYMKPDAAKKEWKKLQDQIAKYLDGSARAKKLRSQAALIRGPIAVTNFVMVAQEPQRKDKEEVDVSTNLVKKAMPVVVACNLRQTEQEIVSMGISSKLTIKRETSTTDVEVVETKVVKTIEEIRRVVRSRVVVSKYGNPQFEEYFLSGGTGPVKFTLKGKRGQNAVAAFFGDATLDERERLLVEALQESPGDKELWNLLGRCLTLKKEPEGAVVCFRIALKLDENHEFALVNLANAYVELGFPTLASGVAVLARCRAKDAWCVKQADALLLK